MIRGPLTLLALLALALAVLFAAPAIASAHSPTHLGFCKNSEIGTTKVVAGHTYRCTKDGKVNEWELVTDVQPSGTPSATASGSAAASVSASSGSGAGTLPTTGGREDLLAVAGSVLVGAGAAGVLFGRRRRTRFEA